MPETLTPANSLDTGVEVGLGNELIRAATVKAFVQKLLNRTEWAVQNLGKLASANTWTNTNTFQAATAVQDTLSLKSDAGTTPALFIDIPASGSTVWNFISEIKTTGAIRVRIYSGEDGVSRGALAIVYNAIWNGTQWSLSDSAKKAIALIWRYDDIRLVGKAAGSAAWVTWPASTLTGFGSTFLSEIVQTARSLAVGNTDANRTNGFRYPSPGVSRLSPVPLGSLWGNVQINAAGHIMRAPVVAPEYDQIWIPIRIPLYCWFQAVKVHFMQLQASQPDEFQLMRRQGYQAWEAVGGVETHGTYGDTVAVLHSGGASTEVFEGYEWAYRWKVVSGDPAVQLNRIIGVEIEWTDIGPSNRVG